MRTAGRGIVLAVALALALGACGGDDDNGDAADAKLRAANASCEAALEAVAPTGTLASYAFAEWGDIRDEMQAAAPESLPEHWVAKPPKEPVAECTYLVLDHDPAAACSVVTVAIVIEESAITLADPRVAADDACSANED